MTMTTLIDDLVSKSYWRWRAGQANARIPKMVSYFRLPLIGSACLPSKNGATCKPCVQNVSNLCAPDVKILFLSHNICPLLARTLRNKKSAPNNRTILENNNKYLIIRLFSTVKPFFNPCYMV